MTAFVDHSLSNRIGSNELSIARRKRDRMIPEMAAYLKTQEDHSDIDDICRDPVNFMSLQESDGGISDRFIDLCLQIYHLEKDAAQIWWTT